MTDKCAHNDRDDLNFKAIFKLHHHRVYVICLRMTGSVAEAEDLTQEVFVHLFRRQERFRDDAAFSSRLHRLTVQRVLMRFRKNMLTKEQPYSDPELPAESSKGFNHAPVLNRSGIDSKSRLYKARLKMRQLLTRRTILGKIDDCVTGPDPVS